MSQRAEANVKVRTFVGSAESVYRAIWIPLIGLTALGLVMVLSASTVKSLEESGNTYSIFVRQCIFLVIAIVAMLIAMRMSQDAWRIASRFAIPLGAVALFLPRVPGIGHSSGGNTNWIGLGGFTIQPSEFAKLGLILWCAAQIRRHEKYSFDFIKEKLLIRLLPGFVIFEVLIMLGRDLGTALLVGMIFTSMLFISGVPFKKLIPALFAMGLVFLYFVATHGNRTQRFSALFNPFSPEYYKDAGWQPAHSLMSLASGGFFGVGLGASRQKWGNLAEAHTDFIFAVIGEEMGLLGTLAVLLMYGILIFAILRTASRAPNAFARISTAGIACWFLAQIAVNLGSVTSTFPVVGVTLPFISYGGSSLIANYIAIGYVLGVAKSATQSLSDPLIVDEKSGLEKES